MLLPFEISLFPKQESLTPNLEPVFLPWIEELMFAGYDGEEVVELELVQMEQKAQWEQQERSEMSLKSLDQMTEHLGRETDLLGHSTDQKDQLLARQLPVIIVIVVRDQLLVVELNFEVNSLALLVLEAYHHQVAKDL